MDEMARLGDGFRQVPRTACYQDSVLFIVMLQGSAATALSPSDLSIIQPVHECTASGLQVWAHPPYWVDYTILINHAPSQELVIYSEVIMSFFNYSLTDSLTPSTQQLGQDPRPHEKVQMVPPPGKEGSEGWPRYGIFFHDPPGTGTSTSEASPNSKQANVLITKW